MELSYKFIGTYICYNGIYENQDETVWQNIKTINRNRNRNGI